MAWIIKQAFPHESVMPHEHDHDFLDMITTVAASVKSKGADKI